MTCSPVARRALHLQNKAATTLQQSPNSHPSDSQQPPAQTDNSRQGAGPPRAQPLAIASSFAASAAASAAAATEAAALARTEASAQTDMWQQYVSHQTAAHQQVSHFFVKKAMQ